MLPPCTSLRICLFHILHFLMEHAGGDTQRAVAQNDDLLHAVGSSHTHPPPLADLMSNVLDEHIGGFGFLGVDHMDIVVLLNAAGVCPAHDRHRIQE